MFDLHNQERAADGKSPLALNATLVAVARQRAQEMAAANCFSHYGPVGGSCPSSGTALFIGMINGAGYAWTTIGENIAKNNYPDSQTVEVAMNGFMGSPGHRANILNAAFGRVGIGVAVGPGNMKYFAVIFSN